MARLFFGPLLASRAYTWSSDGRLRQRSLHASGGRRALLTATLRRFIVVGQGADASGAFLLDDFPGTSGRLDVLGRCIRAALLISHGLRMDVELVLVLKGSGGPKAIRIDGRRVRFLRPDERRAAILLKKATSHGLRPEDGWFEWRPGISIAVGGLELALALAPASVLHVLERQGPDIREAETIGTGDVTFVIGDHHGFSGGDRALLAERGARPVSVGPVDLHAEDVVTLIGNELDRRAASPSTV